MKRIIVGIVLLRSAFALRMVPTGGADAAPQPAMAESAPLASQNSSAKAAKDQIRTEIESEPRQNSPPPAIDIVQIYLNELQTSNAPVSRNCKFYVTWKKYGGWYIQNDTHTEEQKAQADHILVEALTLLKETGQLATANLNIQFTPRASPLLRTQYPDPVEEKFEKYFGYLH